MRIYFNDDERCEECGSTNVQSSAGGSTEVCKDCGHVSHN